MKRGIITFFREEKPVAKVLLDLSWSGQTVKKWSWEGPPSLCASLADALPKDDTELYVTWYSYAHNVAEREGLTIKNGYEGEPLPEYDHYYHPDDPNGPAFKRRAAQQ